MGLKVVRGRLGLLWRCPEAFPLSVTKSVGFHTLLSLPLCPLLLLFLSLISKTRFHQIREAFYHFLSFFNFFLIKQLYPTWTRLLPLHLYNCASRSLCSPSIRERRERELWAWGSCGNGRVGKQKEKEMKSFVRQRENEISNFFFRFHPFLSFPFVPLFPLSSFSFAAALTH